jgi:hypothetical protein
MLAAVCALATACGGVGGATHEQAAPARPAAVVSSAARPAAHARVAHRVVRPRSFGAVGNGHTDDTAALQRALDALHPGDQLVLPAGHTFAHRGLLYVRRPDVEVMGPGRLLATDQRHSAIEVEASHVRLGGHLVVAINRTTRRGLSPVQSGIFVHRAPGLIVDHVSVRGAAAAGIHVDQTHGFRIEHVRVAKTRADGIYVTGGSSDGYEAKDEVRDAGDDSFSVVSYRADASVCHHIRFVDDESRDNVWGHGFAVAGARGVKASGLRLVRSSASGIYIASERSYDTRANRDIQISHSDLIGSNVDTRIQGGAILIYNDLKRRSGDVTISNVLISRTRSPAFQVGIINTAASFFHISMRDITVHGGTRQVFYANRSTGYSVSRVNRSSAS